MNFERYRWREHYYWRDLAARLDLKVPHWKAHALDYLESVGQRFCVDFGTENALEKAREHWRENKHKWSVN
jgi:hypothetical protein